MSNESYIGNVKSWIDRAYIDYYTQFIQMWIPFNAWYMHTFNVSGGDRGHIDEIKNTENDFRNRIISLLENTNGDLVAVDFKREIALLHNELDARTIPNHQNKITFQRLDVGLNPNNTISKKINRIDYKIERFLKDNTAGKPNKSVESSIFDSRGNTIFFLQQSKHDLNELQTHSDFISLNSNAKKENLRLCYMEVQPRHIVNLVSPNQRNGIKLHDNVCFIENSLLISQSLIEVLYQLRCKLFHGEITPTTTNQKVYEHSFNLLKILVKEII
ncbi:MAG TPA: hypothetical protein VFD77_08380 [Brumimicrobium sp.]|nr:hypothetical protein [Brumimicrobium sp.]